jgi:hypothetical protein
VRAIVNIQKVLEFGSVRKEFDQNLELNKILQLYGSLLVMDGDEVVAVICHTPFH